MFFWETSEIFRNIWKNADKKRYISNFITFNHNIGKAENQIIKKNRDIGPLLEIYPWYMFPSPHRLDILNTGFIQIVLSSSRM